MSHKNDHFSTPPLLVTEKLLLYILKVVDVTQVPHPTPQKCDLIYECSPSSYHLKVPPNVRSSTSCFIPLRTVVKIVISQKLLEGNVISHIPLSTYKTTNIGRAWTLKS